MDFNVTQLERVGEYMTIKEYARIKQVSEYAVQQYLQRNPQVRRYKIGFVNLVRESDMTGFVPREFK